MSADKELKEFGRRLAQERRHKSFVEKRDLLPNEIAGKMDVALSTYLRWENGEAWPRESAFIRVAKFFGVSPAWLRYGIGEREAAPPSLAVDTRKRKGA